MRARVSVWSAGRESDVRRELPRCSASRPVDLGYLPGSVPAQIRSMDKLRTDSSDDAVLADTGRLEQPLSFEQFTLFLQNSSDGSR